jgi:hypothetical protein
MRIKASALVATAAIILFEISAGLLVFSGPQVPGNATSGAESDVVVDGAHVEGREPLDGYGIEKGDSFTGHRRSGGTRRLSSSD